MRRRRSMRKFLTLLLALVVMAPVPATADEPGYITLSFGRFQWVSAANCAPLTGGVPLDQVAAELATRGLSGVGSIVTSRTEETNRKCLNNVLSASWADAASLRDTYGWSFISASATYPNMTTLTPEQQYAESCGTLDTFIAHGHTRAWGMFAYPNNKYTEQIQTDVVSSCFAFGRTYARFARNLRSTTAAPWLQKTHSLAGGKCNVRTLPCYTATTDRNTRYQSPVALAAFLNVGPDEWAVLQGYRFATGKGASRWWSWDCTRPDWRAHWTNSVELYCWNDYLYILNHLPTGAVVTDPATVANAWGRTLPEGGRSAR
jgi:hypothetical protein